MLAMRLFFIFKQLGITHLLVLKDCLRNSRICTISYADKVIGINCGEYTLINGVEQPGGFHYDYPELKDNPTLEEKAIRFACDVWGYNPTEYLE